jgi:hypothetical protein
MSFACTQIHIAQSKVNLYFCWCIILPHNEIRTLVVQALSYMNLCWAMTIDAICVVPQGCMFSEILPPYSYASWARAATPSRIPLQCCKMYSRMLTIGHQPSRSTEFWLNILGYITGSRVSYRDLRLLLLCSVSNNSDLLGEIPVSVGTGTKLLQWFLPQEITDHCNWAGFTTKNLAIQHFNFGSNWVFEFALSCDMISM